MLLEFTVSNFRSIKLPQTLSMLPSSRVRSRQDGRLLSASPKQQVLSTAVLYGANASGKSNLLRALEVLRTMVLESAQHADEDTLRTRHTPFRLSEEWRKRPTSLELAFIGSDGREYTYSLSFNYEAVVAESLHVDSRGRAICLFLRQQGLPTHCGKTLKGAKQVWLRQTRPYQLLLATGAALFPALQTAFDFFRKELHTHVLEPRGQMDQQMLRELARFLQSHPDNRLLQHLNLLVRAADTGVESIGLEWEQRHGKPHPSFWTQHRVQDEQGSRLVPFTLEEESVGTHKLIAMGSALLRTLEEGGCMAIDELDKSMHTRLTRMLIGLFHSPLHNRRNAQLIFTTHDVQLLSEGLFRHDQIYFCEKLADGSTEASALSDITGLPAGCPLRSWYLSGRFGGLPLIDEEHMQTSIPQDDEDPTR